MFEDITIILLSTLTLLSLIILVILVTKLKSQHLINKQKEIQNDLKVYIQKEYGNFKFEMSKLFGDYSKVNQVDLSVFKDRMIEHIDSQLKQINDKVEQRLGSGFEQTNKTFTNVVERLAKIDEAQKKIESLSKDVISLNDILTDKKSRGVFGEVQLYQLLSSVMGDNKSLYEKQKKLSNQFIADAVIYAPKPLGMVAIDAKFPLDNYKRMTHKNSSENDRSIYLKEFKNDVKKHINDIKNKYIVFDETSDQAIMFIPAEAIFAELVAYHEDLVTYAQNHKVWITSPTTLISTLTMIQVIVKNIERDQQAQVIINELMKLGDEFKRYHERWDKLKRSIDSVSKDADKVHITSKKISSQFHNISETRFEEISNDEEDDENDDNMD